MPRFIHGELRGSDSELSDSELPEGFGQTKKKKRRVQVSVEPAMNARWEDQDARKVLADSKDFEVVKRPIVPLKFIRECLEGKHRFVLRVNSLAYVHHFKAVAIGTFIDPSQGPIRSLIENAYKYRILVVDTEQKVNPVFLIVGDFEGNVVLFSDARNIPQELKDVLQDVSVFKLQSDMVEDKTILKEAGIDLLGLADSQVILGTFITPGETALGSGAQSKAVGAMVRPYHPFGMRFDVPNPNRLSLLHAVSDGRVPLLIAFKAAEMRAAAMTVPIKSDENVFDLIIDVLNRVAAVPRRVVTNGRPARCTVEENWLHGKEESPCPNADINDLTELKNIRASQHWWLPTKKKRTTAYRTAFWSEEDKKAKNRVR